MNPIVPRQSSTSLPSAPADPAFADRLRGITSRLAWFGHVPKLVDCEIGPGMRLELSRRREAILVALAHRDREGVETAVMQLFTVLKLSRPDAEAPEDLATIFAAHLGQLPAWAVVQACEQLGHQADRVFAPAAPEIERAARQILVPLNRELFQIEAVLRASGRAAAAPAARERIGAGFQRLSTSLDAVVAEERERLRPKKREGVAHE